VCASPCKHVLSGSLTLYVDIDADAMSKATRAYLRGQNAVNEAQDAQPNAQVTQGCNSMDSVTADQERRGVIAEHPIMQVHSPRSNGNAGDRGDFNSETENRRSEMVERHWNMAVPSCAGFPNVDTSARGQGTVHGDGNATSGSGRAPNRLAPTPNAFGTNTGSRSSGSDNLARDEDDTQVSMSEEPDTRSTEPAGSGSTGMEAGPLLDTRSFDSRGTAQDGDGDGDALSDFRPHILHEPHEPVPIAIVNRSPTGSETFPCY
jgi:hypothetical protein